MDSKLSQSRKTFEQAKNIPDSGSIHEYRHKLSNVI